jgi:hypothetical protein
MRRSKTLHPALAVVISVLVVTGCTKTVYVTTTDAPKSVPSTTTTIKPKPTTVAPIDYGSDCKGTTYDEIGRLVDAIVDARAKWEEDKEKSYDVSENAFFAVIGASRDLRSYIRSLDIPFASAEQKNFVDAIQDYVDALNQYWESDREDLSVNDYLIPLTDATTDFFDAIGDICYNR